MSLTQQLRDENATLWEQMVTHPFVLEMGAGTLPLEKFQRYLLQDYVFLRDFSTLLALAIAKAPGFDSARRFSSFLTDILQGEEGLFRQAFRDWGLPEGVYTPPTPGPAASAFGELIREVAYSGSFQEVLTVLVVTEWTYLDWATRLVDAGRLPQMPVARAWTEIHSNPEFTEFVTWLLALLDEQQLSTQQRDRVRDLFHQTLEHELAFWKAPYEGA